MSLSQIPIDIWLCVTSDLDLADLNALVQASRHLYALLNDTLYRQGPSTILKWAAWRGMLTVAERCISLGADVNIRSSPSDPLDRLSSPFQAGNNRPLHCAVDGGHEAMARLLVKNGAEVDLTGNYGRTPLFAAVFHSSDALVRILVDAGARADAPKATIAAAALGKHAVARYLIEKTEGDPRAYNGRSSVSLGTDLGTYGIITDVLSTLIGLGSDIECRDCVGRTPLSHAAETGSCKSVKLLIEQGASIETTDKNGRDPASYARERGDENIIKLVVED